MTVSNPRLSEGSVTDEAHAYLLRMIEEHPQELLGALILQHGGTVDIHSSSLLQTLSKDIRMDVVNVSGGEYDIRIQIVEGEDEGVILAQDKLADTSSSDQDFSV